MNDASADGMRRRHIAVMGLCALGACALADDDLVPLQTALEVSPRLLDFGVCRIGQACPQELTLRNRGNASATLGMHCQGSDARAFTVVEGLTLRPGSRRTLTVVFAPDLPADQRATLRISDPAQAGELEVSLRGRGEPPDSCDDHNPCTDDWYDLDLPGCVHLARERACDDHNACTAGDACVAGVCTGEPLVCRDEIACTQDTCDPTRGCVFLPQAVSCDDADPCTLDQCAPASGCVHSPLPTGSVCGASTCQELAVCVQGSCIRGPAPDGYPCEDGDLCTSGDSCVAGQCTAGTGSESGAAEFHALTPPPSVVEPGQVLAVAPAPLDQIDLVVSSMTPPEVCNYECCGGQHAAINLIRATQGGVTTFVVPLTDAQQAAATLRDGIVHLASVVGGDPYCGVPGMIYLQRMAVESPGALTQLALAPAGQVELLGLARDQDNLALAYVTTIYPDCPNDAMACPPARELVLHWFDEQLVLVDYWQLPLEPVFSWLPIALQLSLHDGTLLAAVLMQTLADVDAPCPVDPRQAVLWQLRPGMAATPRERVISSSSLQQIALLQEQSDVGIALYLNWSYDDCSATQELKRFEITDDALELVSLGALDAPTMSQVTPIAIAEQPAVLALEPTGSTWLATSTGADAALTLEPLSLDPGWRWSIRPLSTSPGESGATWVAGIGRTANAPAPPAESGATARIPVAPTAIGVLRLGCQ